jgi:hypothetical protein
MSATFLLLHEHINHCLPISLLKGAKFWVFRANIMEIVTMM